MIIHNLLLLITGLVGFVTVGLIFKNYKLNSVMNCYLIMILLIISVRFFLLGLIHFIIQDSVAAYYLKYSNFSLIVVPLFYLYYKNLANNNTDSKRTELLHFVFPICFFVFSSNIEAFNMKYKDTLLVLNTIFSLYLFLYTILIYRILKQKIWIKKETTKIINKQNILNSKWATFLFLGTIIIEARLIASLFFESHYGTIIRGFRFGWISAVIWLVILIKILSSPEILYGYFVLHKKIEENKNGNLVLPEFWNTSSSTQINNIQHLQLKEKVEANIINYIQEIEKIIINDKIFRNPTITKEDLANKLNIPKSHILYLFKYHSTVSFSEYKKAVRIRDAMKLINEDYLKESTLEYLSKKVGFPSYNTFFTSFKETVGNSPLEYYKKYRRNI